MQERYDVVVVGGSFSGTAAAVLLARCQLSVLVIDAHEPRNRASSALHAYPGREDVCLKTVVRGFQKERFKYGVEEHSGTVISLLKQGEQFLLSLDDELSVKARFVLLATGAKDELSGMPGLSSVWGKVVHNCLYCDAYELSGKKVAVYAAANYGVDEALKLRTWSDNVCLLTDDGGWLEEGQRRRLESNGVQVCASKVLGFQYLQSAHCHVTLQGREPLTFDGVFLRPKTTLSINLAVSAGCLADADGYLTIDRFGRTECPGLYVCGDASGQLFQAIGATADGNKVARWMHQDYVMSLF